MTKYFINDFNKIENYKKKKFNNRIEKILNNVVLKSYFKKLKKTKRKRRIFSDMFLMMKRFESISSFIPKICKFNVLKKIKKKFMNRKKIIKKKGFILVKINLNFFNSLNFFNMFFVKSYYFYLMLLFRLKHKYLYFEEILKPIFKKNILLNSKNLIFKFNMCTKWVDFSRRFIKLEKGKKLMRFRSYKSKKIFAVKKLKYSKIQAVFFSKHIKYFFNFINLIVSNYYKIIIFLYKKFRRKKLKI